MGPEWRGKEGTRLYLSMYLAQPARVNWRRWDRRVLEDKRGLWEREGERERRNEAEMLEMCYSLTREERVTASQERKGV
jgi:hypothetical protein